jgi:hypothetical protein
VADVRVSRPAALAFIFVTVLLDMLALGLIAPAAGAARRQLPRR